MFRLSHPPRTILTGLTALLICASGLRSARADANTPIVGPPSGSLVIVGGSMKDPVILGKFIELAGGPDSPIVVVPTALGGELDNLDRFSEMFEGAGCTDITVVHTRDIQLADTEEFTAPIERANAVWFTGGRQWRIYDAYAGTKTEAAFRAVLDRGGVIGGSSAGATIQGSYLVRGAPEGNQIMMAPSHEEGFGYLRDVAIDQHVIARNREWDMVPVIERYPHLLGFGIDEDTALVVQGDRAEVIGSSKVLVYNHALFDDVEDGYPVWFEIEAGDVLHLGRRVVVDPE